MKAMPTVSPPRFLRDLKWRPLGARAPGARAEGSALETRDQDRSLRSRTERGGCGVALKVGGKEL